MTSRKEDEKNERIIRNLLKLPENRRCINCNSLVCCLFFPFQFFLLRFYIYILLLYYSYVIGKFSVIYGCDSREFWPTNAMAKLDSEVH